MIEIQLYISVDPSILVYHVQSVNTIANKEMHGALQSVNIHYTESRSFLILEGWFGYVNEELKKSFQTKDNPEPF